MVFFVMVLLLLILALLAKRCVRAWRKIECLRILAISALMFAFGVVGVVLRLQVWTILGLLCFGGCHDMLKTGWVTASNSASPIEERLSQSLVCESDPIELDSVGL